MESLFEAIEPPPLAISPREAFRRASLERSAAEWDDYASTSANNERGRAFAADCRAAALRLRDEIHHTPNEE